MFTTPCFIRKNTLELHKKLRELGYREYDVANLENPDTKYLCTDKGLCFTITPGCELDYVMDCGTNEGLFLAIAALRDDSDIHQWFIAEGTKEWYKSENKFCNKRVISNDRWRKTTVEELIEHFKN